MYGQFPRSVQICSECLPRSFPRAPATLNFLPRSATRFQSTASQVQATDRGLHDSHGKHNENQLVSQRRQNPVKYRHWKPHEARNLGVDALGKPAEVLIIPPRERKLPDILTQDAKDQQPKGYALLENDSGPLSWEEIQKNLLTVRDVVVEKGVTTITAEQWKELKRTVTKSFTRDQLKKYLLENSNTASAISGRFETVAKRSLTSQIMGRVWNLEIAGEDQSQSPPSNTAVVSEHEPPEKTMTTAKLKAHKAALELALVGDGRILRNISQQHHVQIDVFRDRSEVVLTGDLSNVRKAQQKLGRQLKRTVFQRSIELTDSIKLLTRALPFDNYLKTLMQKFSVRISRRADTLSISSFDEASLDLLQQELTVIARMKYRNAGHTLLRDQDASEVVKVRHYPSRLSDWISQTQIWFRQMLRNSHSKSKLRSRPELDLTAVLVQARARMGQTRLPQTDDMQRIITCRPTSFRHNIAADIGQALSIGSQAIPTALQSAFVTESSLLPQFFLSDSASPAIESQHNTILVRLEPSQDKIKLPSFTIHMTAEDISRGLQQPLKMTKLVASFGSAVHDLLLPSEKFDVRATRSADLVLFDSVSQPPSPRHAPLLKSFATLVQDMQTHGPSPKSPVHQIDLVPLLREPAKLARAKSASGDVQYDSTAGLSDDVLQVLSAISKQKAEPYKAAYFIEPPLWMDTTTYADSSHPNVAIEHTISGPLFDDGTGQCQNLRIVPTTQAGSVESVNSSGSGISADHAADDFETVLRAAVDLAHRLTMYSNSFGDQVDAERS